MIETIRKRRSVRLFDMEREVGEKELLQILECGHLAPSAKNAQPWYFVVVKNKELIKKIFDAPTPYKPEGANILDDSDVRFRANYPAILIVVFFEKAKSIMVDERFYGGKELPGDWDKEYSHSDIVSIGTAIQNMHLACEALGIGACITGEVLDIEDQIHNWLGVDKEEYLLVSAIRLGYSAKEYETYFERNPIEEHYKMVN